MYTHIIYVCRTTRLKCGNTDNHRRDVLKRKIAQLWRFYEIVTTPKNKSLFPYPFETKLLYTVRTHFSEGNAS